VSELAQRFEDLETLLRSIDPEVLWKAATDPNRRVLIDDLIDAVVVYPDHLQVEVNGAPPLKVALTEVGLRSAPGTTSCVSEGGLEPPPGCPD
jgi:hypothetical protein